MKTGGIIGKRNKIKSDKVRNKITVSLDSGKSKGYKTW